MANKTPLTFATIPAWTHDGVAASALTFFEAVALSGLEGQWIRLDAKTQRATLGFPVFGRQEIKVADGVVRVRRSTAFGMDSEVNDYDLAAIREAAESGLRVSPGVIGARYL